jgi:hypothetical protein
MQLEFFQKYFFEGWAQLFRGNIAFFNKVFQTFIFPRVMLVAALMLWMLWSLLFSHQFIWISIALLISLAISLFLGIPRRWYNRHLLAAFIQIPRAALSMMLAITHIGKARKHFIHTPHGETETKI